MDIDALNNLITQKRTELGQRIASTPQVEGQYREQLFGGDKQLSSLYSNEEAKIKELYDHDKRLATYADPNSSTYLADPYQREVARAKQHQGTVGELADIQTQRSKRKDVLGDALDRAMKMMEYGLKAQELEYEGLQKDRDFKQRQKESGTAGDGSGSLTDLFNAITGLQGTAKEATPKATGKTSTRVTSQQEQMALEKKVRDQHPGENIRFTKNKDGTLNYAVEKPNQLFLEGDQADAVDNIDETIRKLVAATIAASPKQASGAKDIYNTMFPKAEKKTIFQKLLEAQPDTTSAAEGTMRVRNKQTGETGTIPVSEFDPAIYDPI